MDVNMLRQMDADLHELLLCNDDLTFFYDETGNCGKFSLREDGVNDPTALNNDFILGGIAYHGSVCPANAEKMIVDLRLQSKELKFKNIYRSKDFMTFIGSHRASVYINWLYNSRLYIHFATINNLYYALVDIVDSLWESQPQFLFSHEWVMQLKSALYNFCKEQLDDVLDLLYQYEYPNIAKDQVRDFCNDFNNLILEYNDTNTTQGFLVECFRQMLKYAGKHGELVFLHDNESNLLVEEYYTLYLGRCYTYKYATHHFDFEKVILEKMQNTEFTDNGAKFINYDFLDSKDNPLIQVCDVFVGLLAKLFEYLDSHSFEDLARIDSDKNSVQLLNLAKVDALIGRSDAYHPMMIQNINDIRLTQERMQKLHLLTRTVKP